MNSLLYISCFVFTFSRATYGLKEEECVEVGFARTSYILVEDGYQDAKKKMVEKWINEDKDGYPTYSNMYTHMKNISRSATLLEETSKEVLKRIRKTRVGKRCAQEHLLVGVEKHVMPLIQMDKEFAQELGLVLSFQCLIGSPYPNVDGTCINEEAPDMGAVGAKFLRLMPPASGRGGFSLRDSGNADISLPSAREVSRLVKRHLVRPDVSKLFIELGDFIARDSFSIPESPVTEGVDCCKTPDNLDCQPIFIDEKDALFKTFKCINYKRSVVAQAILGHRESFSAVSSFLDATPIYGPTNEAAFQRKTSYFGYIKAPDSLEEEDRLKDSKCQFPVSFKGCFNLDKNIDYIEDFDLLLTLEHNKIADMLAAINPHFDDALLYNEARRILIAEHNNILYGEFLPILMGNETVAKHSLRPGGEGPGSGYINEVNPGILNSFAVSAFRNPSMLTEWRRDWGKTNILSTHHYESIRDDIHQDFLAMDIQRGRDQGLPGYESWRKFCENGKHISSWKDYEELIPKEAVEDLKKLYQDEINDVDLQVSLLELPEEGAVVGKTTNCILADQFARLKSGNRFYWEFETSMLANDQKDVIRSTTAAALLCRHLAIEMIPSNPFKGLSNSNALVECKSLSQLNLSAWKDTVLIEIMEKSKSENENAEKVLELKDNQPNVEPSKADGSVAIIETIEEDVPTEMSYSNIPTTIKGSKEVKVLKKSAKESEPEIDYDNKTKDINVKREEMLTTKLATKEEL